MIRRYFILVAISLSFFSAFSQGSRREVMELDLTRRMQGAEYHKAKATETGLNSTHKGKYNSEPGWMVTPALAVPIKNASPFFTLSAVIDFSSLYQLEEIGIEISWSENGKNWTDFTGMEKDEDATPGELKIKSVLQFKEPEWKFFKLKINCSKQGPEGSSSGNGWQPSMHGGNIPQKITLHFYSPGDISSPQIRTPETQPPTPDLVACPCPQPGFATRTQWGCPDGQNPSCSNPTYTTVTHLIVHHSAGSNISSNWAAVVNAIWNDHVNVNGWCDIGYNWLIDPNGVIYEGRGGGNNVVGAHFCGYNTFTMGTCMLGNFTSVNPSAAAMEKLRDLLAWKCCSANIDPLATSLHAGSALTINNICGHRNGCSTACPGDLLYAQLPQLRSDVSDYIANNCTPLAPSNDDPCNSTQLAVGTSCSFQAFTNANATNSAIPLVLDALLCDGPSYGDVWFHTTVPPSGQLIIDTEPGTIDDIGMAIYSGINCSILTYLGCYINGSTTGPWMPIANLNGLIPGTEIWIRAWEFNNNDFGTFGICVWDPCPLLPSAPVLEATPEELCEGDSVLVTVTNGNPGTNGAWAWYTDGCGTGSPFGTGGSFSTSLVQTTTFYVRAEGNCGVSACEEVTVNVIPFPTAGFGYTANGLGVEFSDSSHDAGNWSWDFGDGNTSSQANPVHTYSSAGNYSVTLIVTNACGSDTLTETVFVQEATSIPSAHLQNIIVSPNPGNGNFNILFPEGNRFYFIRVMDARGRQIAEDRFFRGSGIYPMELSVKTGIYFLRIQSEEETATLKLIVQ